MAGLILEIQRDSLDQKVPIDALLRRVKLSAAKLGLDGLEHWVENELNGYQGELPTYRKVQGQPAGWNPYNGWIPIYLPDPAFQATISQAPISQAIGTLQDLLEHHDEGLLHFPVPPENVALLNSILNFQTSRMVVQIGRGHVVGILEAVRNLVLDWSIAMEKNGVIGEGMSFGSVEKKDAQGAMTTFNIGNIASFIGNLGGRVSSSGGINVASEALERSREVALKIRRNIETLCKEGADSGQLVQLLDEVDAELGQPVPNVGALKRNFEGMSSILSNAAGNLMSEGAIAMISGVLRLLGG